MRNLRHQREIQHLDWRKRESLERQLQNIVRASRPHEMIGTLAEAEFLCEFAYLAHEAARNAGYTAASNLHGSGLMNKIARGKPIGTAYEEGRLEKADASIKEAESSRQLRMMDQIVLEFKRREHQKMQSEGLPDPSV